MKTFSGVDLDKTDPSDIHSIRVVSRFQGGIKNKFLADIKKGEVAADLLRDMAKHWYDSKKNTSSTF